MATATMSSGVQAVADIRTLQDLARECGRIRVNTPDVWRVAVHEAGHAFAAHLFQVQVDWVVLTGSGASACGECRYAKKVADDHDWLLIALAGIAAENALLGTKRVGNELHYRNEIDSLRSVFAKHEGANEKDLPIHEPTYIEAMEFATKTMREFANTIKLIALALAMTRRLTGDDVEHFCVFGELVDRPGNALAWRNI